MSPRLITLISGGALLGLSILFYSQTLVPRFATAPLARNPMAFPRLLTLALALGALVLILQALFVRRAANGTETVEPPNWPRAVLITSLAGAYFWAFEIAGFLAATLVFLPLVIIVQGYRRMVVILPVTAVTLIALWYLFARVFRIRPPGPGLDDLLRLLSGGG